MLVVRVNRHDKTFDILRARGGVAKGHATLVWRVQRDGAMKRTLSILAGVILLGSIACDKPGQDAEKKIDNAQQQGTTEITNAQVKEDKKVAGAESDFAKARDDYRHDMQTNLDDLDKKLADLDGKTQRAAGNAKSNLAAKSQSLHSERDAFARDLDSLGSTPPAQWDAAKARVDHEWDALKKNTDKAL